MHRILWSVSLALALLGNGCAQAALPKDAPKRAEPFGRSPYFPMCVRRRTIFSARG